MSSLAPWILATDSFNWWTDVLVPFGSALIGGGFALFGAWRGAKWAAEEQRRHASEIDAERGRARLQSEAVLRLEEVLDQLEYRARAMDQQWERTPNSMSSNWNTELTQHLYPFEVTRESVQLRIRDETIKAAIDRFE